MPRKILRLIGGLTVARKLALIYFLDLITVLFISGILINEKYIAINFSEKELIGNQYIGQVRDVLLQGVAQHAAQPLLARMAAFPLPASNATLAAAIVFAEKQFGQDMHSAVPSRAFAAAMAGHDAGVRRLAAGRELLTRIGNQSNLILDPDLDSYYTMSLIVLRFPELLDVLDSMRRLTAALNPPVTPGRQNQQTEFLILEGRFDTILAGIDSDYQEAFSASTPQLQVALAPSQARLVAAVRRFRADSALLAGSMQVPTVADNETVLAVPAAAASLLPVLDALHLAWTVAQSEEQRLLVARNSQAFHRMWLHLGTALLLMGLILTLVTLVARQIAMPIRQLAGVADRVRRTGDYSLRASWDSRDEIGRLVAGFNGMLAQLDAQRISQQDLVAQASAAQAQRILVESIPIALIVTSIPDHRVLHANAAARSWLGDDDQNPWHRGMTPPLRSQFFQSLSDTGMVDEFETHWSAGPTPSWALVSARCLDYQGQSAVLATFTPMNRFKQLEAGLQLWAKVFEASSESIVVMDNTGRVVTVNPAFRRGTAFEMHELIGKTSDMLMSERNPPDLFETIRHVTAVKGSWQGQVWLNRRTGESYPAWLVMNAVRDPGGSITHFIAMALDITERKANEQRIHYLAHHDVLTGLPNRFTCNERLTMSIQQARRQRSKVAVLFLDLDRFKNINDSLGHHVGDLLLCSVASRFTAAVREGDTVSRLGGDEFVIILNNVGNAEEIGKVVEQRIIPAVRQSHLIDGHELYVSCSVGVAVFPDDAGDIETLMRHADSAMYQAKKLGRNNCQFFTSELNARVTRHLHLETDLRHAVARNELVLHYQPRMDARTGAVAGVESLVRWYHPSEGLIAPAQFIPLAEESGLIIEIGAWIIAEACRQHQLWRQAGLGSLPISINLSAVQLQDANLTNILMQAIAASDVPASQIELELTESLLMEDVVNTILVLERIKALGFSLSIDDFGTGYSSLNYLCRFPINKLKIDRSFIQNIHTAADNLAVTKAIIGLGHTLGLEVVAEGVEHGADALVLEQAGCDELQGFYFSRPLTADQCLDWITARRSARLESAANDGPDAYVP